MRISLGKLSLTSMWARTFGSIGVAVLLLMAQTALIPSRMSAQITSATPSVCGQVLPLAMKNLAAHCSQLDRNQVCYANPSLHVEFANAAQATATPVVFRQIGDTIPIISLQSLTTTPLNLKTGEWGLAVLKVQTTLPGTIAGQAVTFVLYGDTRLVQPIEETQSSTPGAAGPSCSVQTTRATALHLQPDASAPTISTLPSQVSVSLRGRLADNSWLVAAYQGQSGWLDAANLSANGCEMNRLPTVDPAAPATLDGPGAFYFATGVSAQSACQDLPVGGLLIHSPSGQKVRLKLNGADLTIGSTVLFSAQAHKSMSLAVLDGQVQVTARLPKVAPAQMSIQAGQSLVLPLGNPPVVIPTVHVLPTPTFSAAATGGSASATAIPQPFAIVMTNPAIDGLEVVGPPAVVQPVDFRSPAISSACAIARSAGMVASCGQAPATQATP
jgi:hypothetical protein